MAVDHCSRRVMGSTVFRRQPTSLAVCHFLERFITEAGRQPRHLVSDQGRQFTATEFRKWCHRRGIRQRYGAIGRYGNLAVIERCIRTFKDDCTRRLISIPYRLADFEEEIALYFSWYNGHRPHTRLRGATPDEAYHRLRPAHRAPRFEPRPLWPRRSPCASPMTLVRGHSGAELHLLIRYDVGRRHLPIFNLKRVA